MTSVRERDVEKAFVKAVKECGGICPKFTSPGTAGMPDRMVLLPGGRMVFAELKRKGEKPRPIQVRRHEELRRLGFRVYVIDDADAIGEVLHEIQGS